MTPAGVIPLVGCDRDKSLRRETSLDCLLYPVLSYICIEIPQEDSVLSVINSSCFFLYNSFDSWCLFILKQVPLRPRPAWNSEL